MITRADTRRDYGEARSIRRISVAEARRLHDTGETRTNWSAPPGPDLPPDFWETAEVMYPEDWEKRSVHLRLEPEVFEFFKAGGKGHITRMQTCSRPM
ncbi:MAG TPA: BrnA antitoxin family protein [Devosia sp.]|nr:BrnA antitoxin family protein [Devosia sp.]